MKTVCVIPARYGSTRFPGKPLADLCGKPLIQWVYERPQQAREVDEVYVATDDDRIAEAVRGFGGKVVMTSPECPSGSDRIAEALAHIRAGIVVNVQGDEPFIDPGTIDACIGVIRDDPGCMISTPAVPIRDEEEFLSPHKVKVVFDSRNVALYFSRSPIPSIVRRDKGSGTDEILGYKHLGLYVYRREALEQFCRMPPARLELQEKLEQLRFLENGFKIRIVVTESDSPGIDTPEDLEIVKTRFMNHTSLEQE